MITGKLYKSVTLIVFLLIITTCMLPAATPPNIKENPTTQTIFKLSNSVVTCYVKIEKEQLISDSVETLPQWPTINQVPIKIETDADFCLDIMWTDWQAPGKIHNADNPVMLTKQDFKLASSLNRDNSDGSKELIMTFKSQDLPLELSLTYKLDKDAFFVRRRLSVRDPKKNNHFLQSIWPRSSILFGKADIIKSGEFGNPVALLKENGGAFFGLEYPASENTIEILPGHVMKIRTGQEIGLKIDSDPIESEWTVTGLSPDSHVQLWFEKYLDSIRVVPLKPYLLYNSWYDVRSPEYTKRPEDIMNEANVLRIVNDFKREMVEKRGLHLDAFVLDDGWDVYKSDWELRKTEFPNGLKPISDVLKEMGTALGIWFGPTGGYSFRKWRIDWMREHGYEIVNDQLCVAGTKYHNLLKTRVTDFVKNQGVAYYKWDGIQFSCSEPDHGHPVGIYSRRAVIESVKDLSLSVRLLNPSVFLNITSGTWLSPWWMKYANMIWMQGYDYGYANVPSISQRDAAITYRDSVLYENYGVNHSWFPLSNLMTHGIIKGYLERLGSESESLEKFTDDVILYFARGVTMYELYISPNILTGGEWDAIGNAIRWAKDRFDILKHTRMIGGSPEKREPYAYVHFSGKRGIVAMRNPFITPRSLTFKLDPAAGIDPFASSLVLEKVYPNRYISPSLYSAGAQIEVPLQGYETAIYEIYPLENASEPLLGGVIFDVAKEEGNTYTLNIHHAQTDARFLNPETISHIKLDGKEVSLDHFSLPSTPLPEPIKPRNMVTTPKGAAVSFQVDQIPASAQLCFLLEPSAQSGSDLPVYEAHTSGNDKNPDFEFIVFIDGKKVEIETEKQEGRWAWIKTSVNAQNKLYNAEIRINPLKKDKKWGGKISAYMIYYVKPHNFEVQIDLPGVLAARRAMPLLPLAFQGDKGAIDLGSVFVK